jgi:hypothetical protein
MVFFAGRHSADEIPDLPNVLEFLVKKSTSFITDSGVSPVTDSTGSPSP